MNDMCDALFESCGLEPVRLLPVPRAVHVARLHRYPHVHCGRPHAWAHALVRMPTNKSTCSHAFRRHKHVHPLTQPNAHTRTNRWFFICGGLFAMRHPRLRSSSSVPFNFLHHVPTRRPELPLLLLGSK